MELGAWIAAARWRTLPALRHPPPMRLLPHQELGARRLLEILGRFGGGLLLDEVGLGKSFTAAAVARELAREGWGVEVCAPAPLIPAWSRTLARFGVEGEIVSHDARGGGAAAAEQRRLLVVDEAHRFRNRRTLRHDVLSRRSIGAAVLIVTATPICNRLDDLAALIRLALPDDALKPWGLVSLERIFGDRDLEGIREALAFVALRRSASAEGLPFPSLRRRVVRFSLGPSEAEVGRALGALRFPALGSPSASALMRKHLRSRLESSREALIDSLLRQRRFLRRASEKLRAGFALTRADFAALLDREEHGMFQELLFPEAFLGSARGGGGLQEDLEEEAARIERLLGLARRAASPKLGLLEQILEESGGPAIVFTRAIATARAIALHFRRNLRCALLTSAGGVTPDGARGEPARVLRALHRGELDLLVLTDLASEGLDLQEAATVIHYDLPWTAVKLRQRDGRARRIGQRRAQVRSVVFVPGSRRESALPYIARKERLSNRCLPFEPIGSGLAAGEESRSVAAAVGGATVVVERGFVLVIEEGSISALPDRWSVHAREEVRPAEVPLLVERWRRGAELLPSRCDRNAASDLARACGRSDSPAAAWELARTRIRAGAAAAIGRSSGRRELGSIVASERRARPGDQRADWNIGAPDLWSTVEA